MNRIVTLQRQKIHELKEYLTNNSAITMRRVFFDYKNETTYIGTARYDVVSVHNHFFIVRKHHSKGVECIQYNDVLCGDATIINE